MPGIPFDLQLLNAFAALLLLLSFAMLSQRRIVTLVNLLALQGAMLCIATLLLAWRTGENHLYLSAALTLGLKVVFLPWLLHRLIRRLEVYWDTEPMLNIAGTMLIGVVGRVLLRAGAADRRTRQHGHAQRDRHRRGGDPARVPHDDHAPQGDVPGGRLPVDGERPVLRRDERDLRHADDRRTRHRARRAGGMLVLGVFFFQIREQFDSLDLHHLESLKED